MSQCGIYEIRCLPTGQRYVGQSVCLDERIASHKHQLHRGSHINARLQEAWDIHGAEQFEFRVIELCQPDELEDRERSQVACNGDLDFNIAPVRKSSFGKLHGRDCSRKVRVSICVDRKVSDQAQKEAGRLRVSYSWIAETALREYLKSKPRAARPKPGASHPAA